MLKQIKKWVNKIMYDEPTLLGMDARSWWKENTNQAAGTIRGVFFKHNHIINVDWDKIYDDCGYALSVKKEFSEQYCYPNRKLGDHCLIMSVRGEYTNDDNIFQFYYSGVDAVFVATNNDDDAVMIALKYK